MKNLTQKQQQSLERVRLLLDFYQNLSPDFEHKSSRLTTAGDMIADIQYVMSNVFQYNKDDIESVRIVGLNSLKQG